MTKVTLGYSRSKGQYHVDEIRGSWPTASYQQSNPSFSLTEGAIQIDTVTVHVGDWLTDGQAGNLGARTHLIVRPYRAEE